MTRINTNVSSLNAQKSLARSNAALQEALTRLSTGLRINSGKDDPAGLIASEALRADITATEAGISNTERANQMIATADSALGQVSSLLNDIRGLVTEAANNGAMSDDQIAANQLQIDSSLAAINRIAQTTSFQGKKLLDGSLGFLYEGGTNFSRVANLRIDQANMGTATTLAISATVTIAATQAQIDIANVPAAVTPANASTTLGFDNAVDQASSGTITLTASGGTLVIDAVGGNGFDGAAGNLSVVFAEDNGIANDVAVDVADGVMTITMKDNTATIADIETALETLNADSSGFATGDFAATATGGASTWDSADVTVTGQMTGGRDAGTATIRVTADEAGVNTKTITVDELGTTTNDAEAEIDGSGNILVHLNGIVSHSRIAEVINDLAGYTAELVGETGDSNYIVADDAAPGVATMANGRAASGGLAQAAIFSVGGKDGSEVFSFSAGASITQMESAVNAMSDSTGVTAAVSGTTLQLMSVDYGSDAFVDVRVISEAAGGIITASVGQGTRDTGTDIQGNINGIEATGTGSVMTVSNSRLDITMEITTSFTGNIAFDITGGGALFQLGPEVVSNQQSRVGITNLNTSQLGGSSGKLYELQSGGDKCLTADIVGAGAVLDEVISQVTTLRGRLGAFQKTTLETNINTLNDTLEALTEAESSIRDADFAEESAQLTRAQILVQSGVAVLSTANSNPQNVLQLLR